MLYKCINPHGGDIYTNHIELDLTTNTNPLGPPDSVLKAAQGSLTSIGHYPDPYCRKLIEALSVYEGTEKDNIIAGNGAAELIYSYVFALRPKKALLCVPTFSEYERALNAAGSAVERSVLREDDDFKTGQAFISNLKDTDADLVFICHPNSPTGRLTDPDIIQQTVGICRDRKIRLFADESFLELTGSKSSFAEYAKDMKELFILKAFTKSYAMPGLRLGYGISSDAELLAAMSENVQAWNVSIPAQAAGIAATGEREYLARAVSMICDERKRLTDALKALGCRVCPSDADFIMFKAVPGLDEKLLKKRIAIKDCSLYPGVPQGWYRAAVKLPHENERFITALQTVIGGK